MASRVEKYLRHLDRISGGVEPLFFPVASTKPGLRGVTEIVYRDLPEGLLTTLTYGLSTAEHADWRHGTPELCMTVRSDDLIWAHALGHLAEGLRGDCPFSYGNAIDFGERIAPGSAMSGFTVFAPAALPREDALGIEVGPEPVRDRINVQGVYPVHASELQFIAEAGFGAFWELDWDPYDVGRPPAA